MKITWGYLKFRTKSYLSYTLHTTKTDLTEYYKALAKILSKPSLWIELFIVLIIYSFFVSTWRIILLLIFFIVLVIFQNLKSGDDVRFYRELKKIPHKSTIKQIKGGIDGITPIIGSDNSSISNIQTAPKPEQPETPDKV